MGGERIIRVSDLSGGLLTEPSPNRIPSKNTPTATNVWYDGGSLKKRNGATIDSSNAVTVDGFAGLPQFNFWGKQIRSFSNVGSDIDIISAIIRNITVIGGIPVPADRNAIVFARHTGDSTANIVGRRDFSGSLSIASGSPTITVTDTSIYRTGDYVFVETDGSGGGQLFLISSIDSATEMTATQNAFTTAAIGRRHIFPSWPITSRLSFAEMNERIWICGQGATSSYITFDATPVNLIMTPINAFPQAAYSMVHKNYMFVANYGSTPSRVAWSALKDPETWPAANFIDVNPDDGFPIVGMFFDGSSIIILKTNSAYKLTGDIFDPENPAYVLTRVYTPPDFVINSDRTVQLWGGKYIMLGSKGFYSYDGGGVIENVTRFDGVRAQFDSVAGFSISSLPDIATEPSATVVNGDYWVSVESSEFSHTSGFKNVVYVLDKNFSFWRWNQATSAQISDFAYRLGVLYGVNGDTSATDGLLTLNTGSVDTGSTAINGTWTSKVYNFKDKQQFLRAYVYYKKQVAGNLIFEYSIDEGSFTSATIDMTGGTGTRVKSSSILIGQQGDSIQFRISNAVASQTFEVYGIEYVVRKLRL